MCCVKLFNRSFSTKLENSLLFFSCNSVRTKIHFFTGISTKTEKLFTILYQIYSVININKSHSRFRWKINVHFHSFSNSHENFYVYFFSVWIKANSRLNRKIRIIWYNTSSISSCVFGIIFKHKKFTVKSFHQTYKIYFLLLSRTIENLYGFWPNDTHNYVYSNRKYYINFQELYKNVCYLLFLLKGPLGIYAVFFCHQTKCLDL